jgi:hypothetical protein
VFAKVEERSCLSLYWIRMRETVKPFSRLVLTQPNVHRHRERDVPLAPSCQKLRVPQRLDDKIQGRAIAVCSPSRAVSCPMGSRRPRPGPGAGIEMKPARAGSLRLLDSLANMRPLSVLLSGENCHVPRNRGWHWNTSFCGFTPNWDLKLAQLHITEVPACLSRSSNLCV